MECRADRDLSHSKFCGISTKNTNIIAIGEQKQNQLETMAKYFQQVCNIAKVESKVMG